MSFLPVPPKSLMQYVKQMKGCVTELIHAIFTTIPRPPQMVLFVKPGINQVHIKCYGLHFQLMQSKL